MPFRPVNAKVPDDGAPANALVEVVFGVAFVEPIPPHQQEEMVKNHYRFKQSLPRLTRSPAFQLPPGMPPLNLPGFPGAGVAFDSIKRDGTFAWRVRAEANSIFVNCLEYTRFDQVWAKARSYIETIKSFGVGQGNMVRAIVLQAIDVFIWDGPLEGYNSAELLNFSNPMIPSSMKGRGPSWHLHEGWFAPGPDAFGPSRQLERTHFDAGQAEEVGEDYFVKLDVYLEAVLAEPVPFDGIDLDKIENMFRAQHEKNKAIVKDVLIETIKSRIGLQ